MMDAAPSIETVYQALNALYRNPDINGKEKASVWLGELQRSVYAWQIADQLLQLNTDIESCYFAAQTMRTKIQYAFHELPASSHQSLRDSLLNHANKITKETPPVIVTQLCLTLADLALQMATWKGSAVDLIQRFGKEVEHFHFLLELLTVLPEEISSRSLRLGANRRSEVTEELTQATPVVLQLLSHCLEMCGDDNRLQTKVLRCLGSWFNIRAISEELIVNSPLLSVPFHALMNKDCPSSLHEAASDSVCSALYAVDDLSKSPLLSQALFQGVIALHDAYQMSVAEEDIDKSLNYCRIFSDMAESFLEAITATPNQGLGDFRSLELLLTCVGHHQYEVAEVTFNFWYRLSEVLYQQNNYNLNEIFKPYVQRLITELCRHCQMDTDHEGVPDDSDDFFDFRNRVCELIKDVVFIVESRPCFRQMFESLQNQTASASWDASEAALFVMCAVAKNISVDENEVVPQVLQAVLSLPESTHIAVRYTSTQLVGELSDWIEKHPQFLEPVLQFLLSGLQQPQIATVAANSLQNICAVCRSQMTQHFTGLLQIVQAVDTFNVSNDAAIGLLKGTALILAEMPADQVTDGLRKLCAIQITPLSQLLQQIPAESSTVKKQDPTVWLDRLAAIFRFTNPTVDNGVSHPCQPVIHEVWPVLSETCDKCQADVRIIERCCRCIRFAVRCVGKGSVGLLNPLVTQMVKLYQVHQHSCFLYLGSILVDEYGGEVGCIQGLLDMLQAFCGPAFKLLEEQNGLRNHPDTVDDFFRLSLRFTQRAAVALLQCTVVKPVLCCAIAACALDHRDANASVMKFLSELVKCGRERDDKEDFETRSTCIRSLLQEHGQALVLALINACIYCLPSYMMGDAADVIYELMLIDRPLVCVWLEHVLKALPKESSGGSVTATHKQLTDFHKAVTSAEDSNMVSRAIREFTRLFR